MIFAVIALIITIIVIRSALKNPAPHGPSAPDEKTAGRQGEQLGNEIIRLALRRGDTHLTNVCVEYDGKPAELDNVIINECGVFIIEVKNYRGEITGGEDDYEWYKVKTTSAGNVYEKNVKNPIKQVKRQVYVLANYLSINGVRVWVQGYALLIRGNSPVKSPYILNGAEDIDRVIHTPGRETLSPEKIRQTAALLQ